MFSSGYRRFFSLVTVFSLALHTILGCCAHHSHAKEAPSRGGEREVHSHHCGFTGHHCSGRDTDDSTSGDPASPDSCDADRCSLISPEITTVARDPSAVFGIVVDGMHGADRHASSVSTKSAVFGFRLSVALPVRAYLLCRVLLL